MQVDFNIYPVSFVAAIRNPFTRWMNLVADKQVDIGKTMITLITWEGDEWSGGRIDPEALKQDALTKGNRNQRLAGPEWFFNAVEKKVKNL